MFLWLLAALAAVGVACIAYGVLIEHKAYRLVRRPPVPILPPGTAPLTILHLSDLHFVHDDERKRRFLDGLPRTDVAIVTGDFLAEPQAVESVVAALHPVRGELASFFVLGSNDIWVPSPLNPLRYFRRSRKRHGHRRGRSADLVVQLERDGWIHLRNERMAVDLGGRPVEIVGLNDPHAHLDDLRVAPRHERERFGLAIAHAPEPAPELFALGYDLVVAGHTHGGQVRAPWGPLVNNSSMPLRITAGLFRFGPSFLHISQGLGTSKYAPYRFLCPPQAELLHLVART